MSQFHPIAPYECMMGGGNVCAHMTGANTDCLSKGAITMSVDGWHLETTRTILLGKKLIRCTNRNKSQRGENDEYDRMYDSALCAINQDFSTRVNSPIN